jgi:hypothetical protein
MSATPDGRREPPSTLFSQGARHSGIDTAPSRGDIASDLRLGDMATVDPELFEVFDVEEPR